MKSIAVNVGSGLDARIVAHDNGDLDLVIAHMAIDLRQLLRSLPAAYQVREPVESLVHPAGRQDPDYESYVTKTIHLNEHDEYRLRLLYGTITR